MKKTLTIIFVIFAVIMSILFMNYRSVQRKNAVISAFNAGYEFYNRDNLKGVDITTVINKAVDNNEKYEIKKDASGEYISDSENSIKIYIKMIINEKTYSMERIKEIGLDTFTEFFGEIAFKCSEIKYHEKNGKISEMTFESIQY